MTIILGTWLNVDEERPAPAASTDVAAYETPVSDGSPIPIASSGTTPSGMKPGVPKVDYVIDLNTSVMTPLPKTIIRSLGSLGKAGRARCFAQFEWPCLPQCAASPDGSLLAYVGTRDEGSLQIFTASIDGTGVRQITDDPTGAASPAWSPDGKRIAYEGYGSGDFRNLFVLDVTTGESTQITHRTRDLSSGDQSVGYSRSSPLLTAWFPTHRPVSPAGGTCRRTRDSRSLET
jgi:WD40 repeat protein